MGLLTVCAHHYEGLAWLVGFYALLCYTPHLYRYFNQGSVRPVAPTPSATVGDTPITRQSYVQEILYASLFSSFLYVGATLPCGRFYYENVDGFFGNSLLRLTYEYIYIYFGLLAHLVDLLERTLEARPADQEKLGVVAQGSCS